jgi:putative ABC transport system permease protein
MAMGASRLDILRLVIGKAALLSAAGVGFGWTAAAGVTRLMKAMLYGVQPTDPATFSAMAVTLFVIAIAASYTPARRATRISPIATLRCE